MNFFEKEEFGVLLVAILTLIVMTLVLKNN